MTAPKPTPGPWKAVQHYSDSVSVVDANGFEIITAENPAILLGYAEKLGIDHWGRSEKASRELSPEEQAANAVLAAAAPALLGALEDLLAWANIQDRHTPQAVAVRENARAAIRKATKGPAQ